MPRTLSVVVGAIAVASVIVGVQHVVSSDTTPKDQAMRPGVRTTTAAPKHCRPGTDRYIQVKDKTAHGGKREIWVHRPAGADSAGIPVLYMLHGSTTDDRLFPFVKLGKILDKQMCRTGRPFVIAAPDGQSKDGRDTEFGDSADGKVRVESFITGTAINRVEGKNRRPARLRAIGGVSMGGYGSAAIALRHPDLYTQVASFAGYFKVDDPSETFGKNKKKVAEQHAPDHLIYRPGVNGIRFLLVEGKADHTPLHPGTIHGEADRFAKLLRARHMPVEVLHPPGPHSFHKSWSHAIPQFVDFLTAGWNA
ncbi:MAG TPA: alpha/beta hydrolase-fold protein [Streptosporangiaceae bacterium]